MKSTDKVGIIVNTEYHHATALSIYQTLKFLNLSSIIYYNNPTDKYNLKELCSEYKIPLTTAVCFEKAIVITAIDSNNIIPGYHYDPVFRQKCDFIFVHHRPLHLKENIIKKYFPFAKNIANGIYEKPYSKRYFYQTESPILLQNNRKNIIGVTSRFFENKISIDFINFATKKLEYIFHLIGEGSNSIAKYINNDRVKAIDLCNHTIFFTEISKLKVLLIPYDCDKREYTSIKTSESLTHSIAHKIPLIANTDFLSHNGLLQLSLYNSDIEEAFQNKDKYNKLIDELALLQNKARQHNNVIFKELLEI
jgi:hypothetical protein